MTVMTPSDEQECRNMLYTGHLLNTPAAVRYPRGSGTGIEVDSSMTMLEIGKAKVIAEGKKTAILCFGTFLQAAIPVAEKLNATIIDMRFVKPLDQSLLIQLAQTHTQIVTVEENSILGGAGSAVSEFLMSQQYTGKILHLGLPDSFVEQGTQAEIYHMLQLDSEGIAAQIDAFFN